MSEGKFWVNGQEFNRSKYGSFHDTRIALTLDALREMGARKVIELGGHPWVMTSQLIESGAIIRTVGRGRTLEERYLEMT